MSELFIMFFALGIILVILSFLLFLKNGRFIKHKGGLSIIIIFLLLLTSIAFSSFPSNYTFQIIISILIGAVGLYGGFLTIYKSSCYDIGRILILVSMVVNFFMLFL